MYSNFLYNFYLKHFSFQAKFSQILASLDIGLHVKYPLFLSGLNETRIFSADFRNIFKHQISMKFVHWLPSCMWTDRRTVRHGEANSRFSQLCARTKKTSSCKFTFCKL